MKRLWQRFQLALMDSRPSTGLLMPLVLAVLVIGSALAAILVKHENRSITTDIERARVERERMQMEWSQLQLEEAALSHHARIERAAREQLGMAEPRDYVIVDQSAALRVP
ncbi:MAG: ftsL [Panacagrimonas sp.]|jgi:cell division protein FtsL|nr:cell division protein FtsL [Panacagrimonas sp.]MCC2655629.1 ftsL [Panacagrimonas sp.]